MKILNLQVVVVRLFCFALRIQKKFNTPFAPDKNQKLNTRHSGPLPRLQINVGEEDILMADDLFVVDEALRAENRQLETV